MARTPNTQVVPSRGSNTDVAFRLDLQHNRVRVPIVDQEVTMGLTEVLNIFVEDLL